MHEKYSLKQTSIGFKHLILMNMTLNMELTMRKEYIILDSLAGFVYARIKIINTQNINAKNEKPKFPYK